jgi:hypothetical protein
METVVFWHWLALAAIFIIIEMLAPGTFMLWLALASAAVGVVLVFAPTLPVGYQLVGFALVATVSAFVGRRYLKRKPIESDRPNLNRRGAQYVSQTFTLSEPIVNGRGRVNVEDTVWSVMGEDLPAGAKVRCVGVDGNALRVEKA